VADAEVDTETGVVQVLQDVGRAINPAQVEGQIAGGVVQGIGFALMEEVELDAAKVKGIYHECLGLYARGISRLPA
jgi:CO/xanthine dehydrogenase Mo-binding subunit